MCMAAQWSRPITHSHWRVVNISWVQCCCCTQSAVFCSSSSLYTFSSCTVTGCLYFSFFFFSIVLFLRSSFKFFVESRSEIVFLVPNCVVGTRGDSHRKSFFLFFFFFLFLSRKIHQIMLVKFSTHQKVFFFFFVHTHYVYLWLRKNTGWLFARFGSHSRYYLHKGAVVLLVVRELWKKKMSCSFFICSSIEFFKKI